MLKIIIIFFSSGALQQTQEVQESYKLSCSQHEFSSRYFACLYCRLRFIQCSLFTRFLLQTGIVLELSSCPKHMDPVIKTCKNSQFITTISTSCLSDDDAPMTKIIVGKRFVSNEVTRQRFAWFTQLFIRLGSAWASYY